MITLQIGDMMSAKMDRSKLKYMSKEQLANLIDIQQEIIECYHNLVVG